MEIQINKKERARVLLTTPVFFYERSRSCVEARVGICFDDRSTMDMLEIDACEHNPFHPDFTDDFLVACGVSVEEAEQKLNIVLYDLPRYSNMLKAV